MLKSMVAFVLHYNSVPTANALLDKMFIVTMHIPSNGGAYVLCLISGAYGLVVSLFSFGLKTER